MCVYNVRVTVLPEVLMRIPVDEVAGPKAHSHLSSPHTPLCNPSDTYVIAISAILSTPCQSRRSSSTNMNN